MELTATKRDRIAQWAFDGRPVLSRFHLWLQDVDIRWVQGGPVGDGDLSFVGNSLDRPLILTAGVTALGTKLFGGWGQAEGLDKTGFNRVKKDADARSAYVMSEALWHLTRRLPENHALMVSLGEGLMPKAGETPEMGSNPLLGFGRVYARPGVARFLDKRIHRLINDDGYSWDRFWADLQSARITVWGAAIDTLENTSRFAKGSDTGPMAVLHLFDQPVQVTKPYEGYMGAMVLPKAVHRKAEERSLLLDYFTPRKLVLETILQAYPGVRPDQVHVWTLRGRSRVQRLQGLWDEWANAGATLIEAGDELPTGFGAFTDSGTYAPSYLVGPFEARDGSKGIFICDGYAASAEAIQAASLDPIVDVQTSMVIFSSQFDTSYEREGLVMQLDPDAPDFDEALGSLHDQPKSEAEVELYREMIRHAREAGLPLDQRTVLVDDFFPKKKWQVLAIAGCMLPDPYTGAAGVQEVAPGTYRVTVRAASRNGIVEVDLTLKLEESMEEARLVFSPLLDRFFAGEDYQNRAVKISDSGRIRNELQTLCFEALEYFGTDGIRVRLDDVPDAVLAPARRKVIRQVLEWYKEHHPIWFRWLEIL